MEASNMGTGDKVVMNLEIPFEGGTMYKCHFFCL